MVSSNDRSWLDQLSQVTGWWHRRVPHENTLNQAKTVSPATPRQTEICAWLDAEMSTLSLTDPMPETTCDSDLLAACPQLFGQLDGGKLQELRQLEDAAPNQESLFLAALDESSRIAPTNPVSLTASMIGNDIAANQTRANQLVLALSGCATLAKWSAKRQDAMRVLERRQQIGGTGALIDKLQHVRDRLTGNGEPLPTETEMIISDTLANVADLRNPMDRIAILKLVCDLAEGDKHAEILHQKMGVKPTASPTAPPSKPTEKPQTPGL